MYHCAGCAKEISWFCVARVRTKNTLMKMQPHHAGDATRSAFIKKDCVIRAGTIDNRSYKFAVLLTIDYVHQRIYYVHKKGCEINMPETSSTRKNKHLILDQAKLKKAQKVLGAKTETETIERALEIVISEEERNRRAWSATEKIIKSGIKVKDVFGRLDGK